MSRQFNRRGPVQSQQRKPFCKVCHDAGKCEEEYTSHNVRDRDGKTICITLLNQECRFCFQTGHTVKFCPVLKEREQTKEKYAKECARMERVKVHEEKKKKPVPAPVTNSRGGGFAALADDSDSDEERRERVNRMMAPVGVKFDQMTRSAQTFWGNVTSQIEKKDAGANAQAPPKTSGEEFPALSSNVTLRPHQQHFAAEGASFAATLQKPKPQVQPKQVKVVVPVAQRDAWSDDEDAPAPLPVQSKPRILNWAECDSSDDEDEQQQEPYFSDGDSYRNR